MEEDDEIFVESSNGRDLNLDHTQILKKLNQMYEELGESYLERKASKQVPGSQYGGFNLAGTYIYIEIYIYIEEYEEIYTELTKWEINCRELIDVSSIIM